MEKRKPYASQQERVEHAGSKSEKTANGGYTKPVPQAVRPSSDETTLRDV